MPGPADAERELRHWHALAALALPGFSFALINTLVAPALPEIQRELGVSAISVGWVMTVQVLAAAVSTPIVGRLGDMHGKDRVLVAALAACALGSLLAAVSTSIEGLIAGRALQGLAGATFPLAFGIVRDEFPPSQVGTGIGLASATWGLGGGVGLVIAGPLVNVNGYGSLFWFSFAAALVAVAVAWRYVPASPVRVEARLDWLGAVLLAAGLGTLLLGVGHLGSRGPTATATAALLGGGAALIAVWAIVEARISEPLVEMRTMRSRPVLVVNLVGALTGVGMFATYLIVPQLVQAPASAGYGFAATVGEAGLFMLPSPMLLLAGGPLAGVIGARRGFRSPLLAGLAICAAGLVWLAIAHREPWHVYTATALEGLGVGLALAAMPNLIIESVDPDQTGVSTGINAVMRMIGGSFGTQIVAAVLAGNLIAGTRIASEGAFVVALAIAAAALAAAFLLALLVPRQGGREGATVLAHATAPAATLAVRGRRGTTIR
ncbi:MAG: MFS transporter [Solirubrobacteraceae bacterium]|nr:MFS transporter [Solirubrobacteraceae bacterium]